MSPYRILIVEDNRIEALDLIKIIEAHGYDLAGVAKTGEEAISISREKNPDVILMDIRLAGDMDGFTVQHKINRNQSSPIILLTCVF